MDMHTKSSCPGTSPWIPSVVKATRRSLIGRGSSILHLLNCPSLPLLIIQLTRHHLHMTRLQVVQLLTMLLLEVHTRRQCLLKLSTPLLGPKCRGDHNTHHNNCSSNAHSRAIGLDQLSGMADDVDLLRHSINNLCGRGRHHVADLVRDSRKRGAECGRRKLVQVDWDDPPSSLDEELHEEAGGGQRALGIGKDPCGDQTAADERGNNDGPPAAKVLAEVANDGTAHTSASLHDDTGTAGARVIQFLRSKYEGGVIVLGGVAVVCLW